MKVIKALFAPVLAVALLTFPPGSLARSSTWEADLWDADAAFQPAPRRLESTIGLICSNYVLPPCSSHQSRLCDESGSNGTCQSDEDCISGRSCGSDGLCQGVQDVGIVDCPAGTYCKGNYLLPCTLNLSRVCDESANREGPGKCASDADCLSGRSCNADGECAGTADVSEVDCHLAAENIGKDETAAETFNCGDLVTGLQTTLTEAHVPQDAITAAVAGVNAGTSTADSAPEDIDIVSAFSRLSPQEFLVLSDSLDSLENLTPSNSCPTLYTEVTKLIIYAGNSHNFKINAEVTPVIASPLVTVAEPVVESVTELQTTQEPENQSEVVEEPVQPIQQQTVSVVTSSQEQPVESQPVAVVSEEPIQPVVEENAVVQETQPQTVTVVQQETQPQTVTVVQQEEVPQQVITAAPQEEVVQTETEQPVEETQPSGQVEEQPAVVVISTPPTEENTVAQQTTETTVTEEPQPTVVVATSEPSQPEQAQTQTEEAQQTEETTTAVVSEEPQQTEETTTTVAEETPAQPASETEVVSEQVVSEPTEGPKTGILTTSQALSEAPAQNEDENEAYRLVLQAMQAAPGQESTGLLGISTTGSETTTTSSETTTSEVVKTEEPIVVTSEGPSEPSNAELTTTTEVKSGLNGAVLKILQLNNEFTGKVRSNLESDGKTINEIVEDFTADVYGGVQPTITTNLADYKEYPAIYPDYYTPVEEPTPVVEEPTPVVEEPVPVVDENTPVVEEQTSGNEVAPTEEQTSVEAPASPEENVQQEETTQVVNETQPAVIEENQQEPVQESEQSAAQNEVVEQPEVPQETGHNDTSPAEVTLTTVVSNPGNDSLFPEVQVVQQTEEGAAQNQTITAPAARLLTILRLYKEHIAHRDSQQIVDYRHYGHLKDFHKHLDCLTDSSCDFTKHLEAVEQEYTAKISQQHRLGQQHLDEAASQRGFFGRIWCGIRGFFRRPCPEPESTTTVTVSSTVTTAPAVQAAHLSLSEEEGGFFTFMTSRKLANYLNSAGRHLAAHKEEDAGLNAPAVEQVETVNGESVVSVDGSAEFRNAIQGLIDQLPQCLTNQDIKDASHRFIENAHTWLARNEGSFPQTAKSLEALAGLTKLGAAMGKGVTADTVNALLHNWQREAEQKLNTEFTADGLSTKAQQLEGFRNVLSAARQSLQGYVPVNSVLQEDLESLVDKLDNQIRVFSEAKDASPEQIDAARDFLKKNIAAQVNGVDPQASATLVNSISGNVEGVMNSNFGKSLNADNLQFIVHRVVQGFHADLDRLYDPSKPSDFVLDTDDLDLLTDNVIDELKKSRENHQKVVIDVRDFEKSVQEANKRLDIQVQDSGDKAHDAADLLVKYEDAVYDALGSDSFYDGLKGYVSKYYEVYKAHTQPWQPLVVYSQAYKTLTTDLQNPNAIVNPPTQELPAQEAVVEPTVVVPAVSTESEPTEHPQIGGETVPAEETVVVEAPALEQPQETTPATVQTNETDVWEDHPSGNYAPTTEVENTSVESTPSEEQPVEEQIEQPANQVVVTQNAEEALNNYENQEQGAAVQSEQPAEVTESSTTTTETTTSNDNGTTEQTVTVQSSEQPAAQEPAVESSEQPVSQETTEVQSEQPAPQEPAAIIYEQQQPTAATSDITPADAEAENSPEEAEVAQEQAQATAEAEAPVVNSPEPKALTDEEIAALFSDENPYAPLNNQAILDELSNASDNLQGTPSTTVSTTTTTTVSSDQTANNAGLEVQQTDAPIIIETTKQEIGQPLVDPTLDQHQEQSVANPEALRLLHSTVYSQIRRLDKLSEQDRHFFEFFNRLLGEWASAKDVNAFTRKLDQVIRALQGRPVGLRRLAIADAADSHKIFDKITQLKDSVNGIVGNLGSTYDVAVKLSDTVGQGQHLAQEAKDFFSLKNPILTGGDAAAQNGQSTGFWGKIKGVFGSKRQLERHYGVTDTFDSLKNLYSSLESANNSAQELKKNVETAKKFADGVKEAFKVVGGLGA